MQIILNGQAVVTQQTTLDALLIEKGYESCSVATALNDGFVSRSERASADLTAGCRVEVVAPMQGG